MIVDTDVMPRRKDCGHSAEDRFADGKCRSCHRELVRSRYKPEQRRAYSVQRYGITLEQYDRLLEFQGGCCAVCGADAPGGRGNHFHVDHDHLTGAVRALLCHKCNIGLGCFNDDPGLLQKAVAYIQFNRAVALI